MNNEERILQMLTGMQQDISGIQQDVSGLKQDVSGLKEDVSGLKQDVSELKQNMASYEERLIRFENQLDEQKTIVLNLENNVMQRLNAQYDGYMLNKDKNEILEGRVDAVELRVDRLEIAAG